MFSKEQIKQATIEILIAKAKFFIFELKGNSIYYQEEFENIIEELNSREPNLGDNLIMKMNDILLTRAEKRIQQRRDGIQYD